MKWSESNRHPEMEPWFPREELRRKIVTLKDERLELASEIAWLEGRVIALGFHLEEAHAENKRLRSEIHRQGNEIHRLGNELGQIHHWKLWRLYLFYREALRVLRKLPLIGRIAGR